MIADDIVTEARLWLGTPYVHQASLRGAGCDCLGLVLGVLGAVYGAARPDIPAYTPDWGEVGGDEVLLDRLSARFARAAAGDVAVAQLLVFRMRDGAIAKHLGIVSAGGAAARFIHAYSGRGVVESDLTPPWRRKIAARFVFPERIN